MYCHDSLIGAGPHPQQPQGILKHPTRLRGWRGWHPAQLRLPHSFRPLEFGLKWRRDADAPSRVVLHRPRPRRKRWILGNESWRRPRLRNAPSIPFRDGAKAPSTIFLGGVRGFDALFRFGRVFFRCRSLGPIHSSLYLGSFSLFVLVPDWLMLGRSVDNGANAAFHHSESTASRI